VLRRSAPRLTLHSSMYFNTVTAPGSFRLLSCSNASKK
jgi:hypothetical protein